MTIFPLLRLATIKKENAGENKKREKDKKERMEDTGTDRQMDRQYGKISICDRGNNHIRAAILLSLSLLSVLPFLFFSFVFASLRHSSRLLLLF